MKELVLFPGCSMEGSAIDYLESSQAVAEKLGYRLRSLEGWFCCGATSAHVTDPFLADALPAGLLRLHQQQSPAGTDLTAACAACYNRLKVAAHVLPQDAELAAEVDRIFGPAPAGWQDRPVRVRHLIEIFDEEIGAAALQAALAPRPAGRPLKVAAYYGCLLVRPPEVMQFDDRENPERLDKLLAVAGFEPVDWPHKVECCGAIHGVVSPATGSRLVGRIAEAARNAGADVIAAACPLCQSNLDLRQSPPPDAAPVPVLYFTQLLGLALGIAGRRLGLQRLVTSAGPALAAAGWSRP